MNKQMSQYDKMTKTPVEKLLIQLSIPTIISMLISNIYNMVDTAFVGTLGNSASGAVGIVFGFMAILQAIGFMFGQGCGSMLSRKLGRKDQEGACETASTGFFGAFVLAIIAAIICYIFLDQLVTGLGSTETIKPYAKTYISYILLAAPAVVTCFTMNNILRYEGKAALGMVGMMSGALLNILGDAILMFGFHMGIAGAGLSTCISQYISFFILLSMFLRGKASTKISFKLFIQGLYSVPEVMLTGFPSMLRQGLSSITTVLLNSHAAVYGDVAVAAMSITSRIVFFVFSIALGIGQGFQPISGFNYGAGKYKRLRKACVTMMVMSEIVVTVIGVVVFIKGPGVIHIFRDDPDVIRIASRALRLQLVAQFGLPCCMCVEMLFQSTGQKLRASFLSATRNGLFFIPALLILANVRGLAGIQEAQPVAVLLSYIPAFVLGYQFLKKLPKEDLPDPQ